MPLVCYRFGPVLRARAEIEIMPDAIDLLKTRRSFKPVELAGPPPSAAEIDTLLTVASRVPDHGKLTPWRFIVFEGEARRAAGDAIVKAFQRQISGRQAGAGGSRTGAADPRAAGHRRGQPGRAACENSGMGAGAVGRRRGDEPGARRACAGLRRKLDHRMVRLRPRACSMRSALRRTRKSRASFISAARPACRRTGRGRRSMRSQPAFGP